MITKNSKILITGSSGLVGKNLMEQITTYYNADDILTPRHNDCDLINQAKTNNYLKTTKPDYIFHLAATVGGIQANIDNPYKFLYENMMMQFNLINASIENKVKKVVLLSSVCMYPANWKQPLKEEYILQGVPEPTNEGYALSKICGQKLCEYANRQFDTRFIVLAPTNLYGSHDHFDLGTSHVLQALIRKIYTAKVKNEKQVVIWGDGNSRRDFLYVGDLVDCMLWSMDNIEQTETFLNVGTGVDYSIYELAEMVATVIQYDGEFIFDKTKPNGMRRKLADISKIKALGWNPKTNILDGIKKTVYFFEGVYDKTC